MVLILILLMALSYILAKRSMKDFHSKAPVHKRGRIVIYKNKIHHYSSKFSSSSSSRAKGV
jgi:hypothetical protein